MTNKKTLDSLYYKFDHSRRKITFDSFLGLTQKDIYIIVNLSGNKMIYNFACTDEGGTMINNVLTLLYDTTAMTDTDNLMIIVSQEDKTELYLQQMIQELKNTNELLTEVLTLKIN